MSKIAHNAIITLPKPTVHAKHPFKNQTSHDDLLEYLRERLVVGKQERSNRIGRMIAVDKAVMGWVKMSEADRERVRKQERTGVAAAVAMNLPISFIHLDDMMTYYVQTFAPNRGMFYATGKPDEIDSANQIVTIMNNNAIYTGFFREVCQMIYANLKYNTGGCTMNWCSDRGPKISGTGDKMILEETTVWQGNRITALDNYNAMYDPNIHPSKIYCDGEWASTVELKSHYWLNSRASQGVYYNCEEALSSPGQSGGAFTYYLSPPDEARIINISQTQDGGFTPSDWTSYLSGGTGVSKDNCHELVTMYCKVNPYQLKLIDQTVANRSTRNRYEIWRFTILNDKKIIECTYMNNIHGHIPYYMGRINDDLMDVAAKSIGEILTPLQNFASFLMNTHIAATRKNIWGLTVYDPTIVDLSSIPEGEVSATIAAKPEAAGKDMTKAIYRDRTGQLDTKQTMQDLDGMLTLINNLFPTSAAPSTIANIDRAVDSQVVAVQQGTNRRNQKGAKLLDETIFRPLRSAMYYNILQYMVDGTAVTDFYGKAQVIDLAKLRETDLPYIIGQGLKALDRMMVAGQLQQIIFALIQNPNSAAQMDLLGLIDYWTTMIDIDIDITQFRLPPPKPVGPGAGIGDNGGPPLDPNAAPIQPAVDPAKITAPLG